MHARTARVVLVGSLAAAGAVGSLWGFSTCSKEPSASNRPTSGVQVRSYTVRGVIETLPVPEKPGTQLIIRHEEISDFQASDGRVGMKAMSMPFPVATGLSLEGLTPGDAVEFDFTVDWNSAESYWITRIERRRETPEPR